LSFLLEIKGLGDFSPNPSVSCGKYFVFIFKLLRDYLKERVLENL